MQKSPSGCQSRSLLRAGFALAALALLTLACNLTRAQPTPTPPPVNTPAFATITPLFPNFGATPTECAVPSGWVAYTIQEGDILSVLAEETNITLDELIVFNCIENPDLIGVDEVIYLPFYPPG